MSRWLAVGTQERTPDISIPIPFTSARIDLTLPFGFLPTGLRVVVAIGLFGAVIACVVWLSRREWRHRPAIARVLMGLQLVTSVIVLVVLGGRPIVVRTERDTSPGRVVLAVDLSESMKLTDPQRPTADKLRLARALNLYEGVTADEELLAWEADLHRGETLSRIQAVERSLTPDGGDLLNRIRRTDAIDLVGFGQRLTELPTDPDPLRAALTGPPSVGPWTDLKLPLARAMRDFGEKRAVGVVLFTDGRHNWGESPTVLARTLGERGLPVYPVILPGRSAASDVAVMSVRPVVSSVCRGSAVPVEVGVRVTRWPAGAIALTLALPDGQFLGHTIRHDGTDQTYEVTFYPRLDREGVHTLIAIARPTQPDPRPGNNTRSAQVRVTGYKPRILFVQGQAGDEFPSLRATNAPTRDSDLEIENLVLRPPQAEQAQASQLAMGRLGGNDALSMFDAVILGDVTAEQLRPSDSARLERYVADTGCTLIIRAGKAFLSSVSATSTPDTDPLRRLLPVKNIQALAPGRGGVLERTEAGRRAWFLRLADPPEQDRAVWGGLPSPEWAATGEPKEVAEVLVRLGEAKTPDVIASDPPDSRAALVVRQDYGFGRVFFIGLDPRWRWRTPGGTDHDDRFWRQVAQWAVAHRAIPTPDPAGTVLFGPRESTTRAGEEIVCVLRATEALPRLGAGAVANVRVVRLGEPNVSMGLTPLQATDRPREWIARLRGLPPGRYALEPVIPDWGDYLRGPIEENARPGKLLATAEVLLPDSEESNPDANTALLDTLAAESGGHVFDITEIDDLAALLAARAAAREVEITIPLNRSWWTFGLVVFFLTAEWIIRARTGSG